MKIKEHYKILGLTPTATIEEIKSAYRQQAMKLHPDHNQLDKKKSEENFKQLNDSYVQIMKSKSSEKNPSARINTNPTPPPTRNNFENFSSNILDKIFREFFNSSGMFSDLFKMDFEKSTNQKISRQRRNLDCQKGHSDYTICLKCNHKF